jgi:hypothetical protein
MEAALIGPIRPDIFQNRPSPRLALPDIKWFRARFYFSSKRGVGSDIWWDSELSSEEQCFIFTSEIC